MQGWIDKHLRWIAIPRLPVVLALGQGMFFLAALGNANIVPQMMFVWSAVFAGEFWRPITFLFVPPIPDGMFGRGIGTIFAFFAIYLLWLMGSALEREWGSARFTAYIAIGWLLAMLSAAIAPQLPATNFYVVASVFLAFAWLYPDFQLMLFFIIPVKIKWLALITWIFFGIGLFSAIAYRDWQAAALVIAGVANWFAFFGVELVQRVRGASRRSSARREAAKVAAEPLHVCCVSGWTDKTHPEAQFRYVKEGDEVKCYAMDFLPDEYKQDTSP
ncbi:MAG: hypothetical protein AAFY08_05785 [Planctomycetota bacterium]